MRELTANGTLTYSYVPTKDMIADGLTKALTPAKFNDFIAMLGMLDAGLDQNE